MVSQELEDEPAAAPGANSALAAVAAAFGALGRICVCLDRGFQVLHASPLLDDLLGPGASLEVAGQPMARILGEELFGPEGTLRQLLLAGERREGWRATLDSGEARRLVSVTAAPFGQGTTTGARDPRVAYLVVLRPAVEYGDAEGMPTWTFSGLVARSSAMTRVFRLIQDIEHSEVTVLLTGESGTGKEVVARVIHDRSPRRGGPMVAVNCSALPAELLESELFGHVKGAFTGAVRERAGRFEAATGGTLFLDEVADIPLHLQVKLLRVLQERTFERVGENRTRQADARIVAATNVNLRRAVVEGRFREDLYYRLRVVPIEIPPLRERREDIEPLARFLLGRVGARQGRALRFSPDGLRVLLGYAWPGNVRELENALEHAVAVCKGQTLMPEDLPSEIRQRLARLPEISPTEHGPETGAERDRMLRALEAHRWRRGAAARELGISRTTLWRRMRQAGLTQTGD
jgi:DNA-binding NtrC family response regulator